MAEGRDKQSMGVVTSLTVNPATPYQLNYRGESSGIVRGTGADWFGPLNPLEPTAPPEVKGRGFDIPSGYNLNIRPRAYEAITFDQLRSFADGYDLLRTVIETRKDQLARLSWNIVARGADKKKAKDPEILDRIAKVEKFFLRPDGEHFWDDWLRMVIEDLLVLDAPAIFRRRTFGGNLYALEPIDGGTIKRVIDDWGRTPSAPAPAYQQVLKGFPAVDYTVNDLIYRPRNIRTHKVYGYSPVEQIVMTINIAIRRQVWQLQSFTEGNIPEALIGTPSTWTPDQIRAFQDWFDSLLEGNTGERRRARFVPGEVSKGYVATKPSELFGQAEEWLARIVCFAFNISPQPFVAMMNRATAETAQETAAMDGLAPLQQWVKNLINTVILDDFGYDDIEFQWLDEDELDPNVKSTILDREVASGLLTMNEARAEKGLDPYDHEDADRPMFKSAQGYMPLYSTPEEEAEAEARVAAADAQAQGGGPEASPSAEGQAPATDIAEGGDEAPRDGSPAKPEGVAEKNDRPFSASGLTKADFDESKVERDERGRFAGSGGGSFLSDEEGNPITVYHGTGATFDQFDMSRFGQTDEGWAGQGVYFSTDRTVAEAYGNIIIGANIRAENTYELKGNFYREVQDKGGPAGFTQWLRDNGYDSAKLWSQYMVLDTSQIEIVSRDRAVMQEVEPNDWSFMDKAVSKADWDEESHPRDESGRFASGGGGTDEKEYDETGRDITAFNALSEDEQDAVTGYQQFDSPGINAALRDGRGEDFDEVKLIDSAIASSTLEETELFRGIASYDGKELPWKVGDVISDPAYASTTETPASAVNFAFGTLTGEYDENTGELKTPTSSYMLSVMVPEGSNGLRIPNDEQEENEVLLPRGSRFEIDEIKEVEIPHPETGEMSKVTVVFATLVRGS